MSSLLTLLRPKSPYLSLAFTSASSSTFATYSAVVEGSEGLTVELFLGGVSQGNATETSSGVYELDVTLGALSNSLVVKVGGVEYASRTVTWLRYGLSQWIDFRTDNLTPFSEDISNAVWQKSLITALSASDFQSSSTSGYITADSRLPCLTRTVTIKFEAKADAATTLGVSISNGVSQGSGNEIISLTTSYQIFTKTFTFTINDNNSIKVFFNNAQPARTYSVRKIQFNQGSSSLSYVQTTTLQNRSDWAVVGSAPVLGSSTAVATDDPHLDGKSAVFDGINDLLSGLAALSGTWAIFQSNETALQYVDSAGTQKVYSGGSESVGSVTAFAVGTAGGYTGKLEQREVWSVIPTDAQRLQAFADMATRASAKGITY